jgi:flagellar hook assembly protein FlgD
MLYRCRPNPFRGRTAIKYQFPVAGQVRLRVYDISGRCVRTLQDGFQKPGVYTVHWNGQDDVGRRVSNGVYFYHFAAPRFEDVKKTVMTR